MARNHKAPKTKSPAISSTARAAETKSAPASSLVELLKFAEVIPTGKTRWNVRCSTPERIGRQPAHSVALRCGVLLCDCPDGIADRSCAHVAAVRQFGTVTAKPKLDEQIALYPDSGAVPVRVVAPARKRYAVMNLRPRTAPHLLVFTRPRTPVGGLG